MKITTSLNGRSIMFRGRTYQVMAQHQAGLTVSGGCPTQTGLIRADLISECRLYPSMEEVEKTYPRVLHCLKQACGLTTGEAVNAVHGYLTTGTQYRGSEALARIGGAGQALQHAMQHRHRVMSYIRYPQGMPA